MLGIEQPSAVARYTRWVVLGHCALSEGSADEGSSLPLQPTNEIARRAERVKSFRCTSLDRN